MKFKETKIKDNYLVYPNKKNDNRGFFARYFCKKEFSEQGLNTKWVQINNSASKEIGTSTRNSSIKFLQNEQNKPNIIYEQVTISSDNNVLLKASYYIFIVLFSRVK